MGRSATTVFGTKEWAAKNANCVDGCAHDCHYCYAKSIAIRFKRKTPTTWKEEKPTIERIIPACRGTPCQVMFPSTHDITPETLDVCLTAIATLLQCGHEVLIVSKPHLECIQSICLTFSHFRAQILFRFTIGSADNAVLRFWEPNAPSFDERLSALEFASRLGFRTSVSCEPMLDDRVDRILTAVGLRVTDSIWVGKPNQLRQRLAINGAGSGVLRRAEELLNLQNDESIRVLYARYKRFPLIKWKESIKKVVGLRIPESPGLDV
jgi:DNA repair photolyase